MRKVRHKSLFLIIIFIVTKLCYLSSAFAQIKGDINEDGQVDLSDGISSLQALIGLNPVNLEKDAELSGDGKIGIGPHSRNGQVAVVEAVGIDIGAGTCDIDLVGNCPPCG